MVFHVSSLSNGSVALNAVIYGGEVVMCVMSIRSITDV